MHHDRLLLTQTPAGSQHGDGLRATWQDEVGTMLWQSFSQTISDFVAFVYILFTLWRLESALGTQSTGNEAQYLKGMKVFMRPVALAHICGYFPIRQTALW